jgi:hypothetical protein
LTGRDLLQHKEEGGLAHCEDAPAGFTVSAMHGDRDQKVRVFVAFFINHTVLENKQDPNGRTPKQRFKAGSGAGQIRIRNTDLRYNV